MSKQINAEQFGCGKLFEHGFGVPANREEVMHYFRKSIFQGNQDAAAEMHTMRVCNGTEVDRNEIPGEERMLISPIKIVILGDMTVGKTALLSHFVHGEFDPVVRTTIPKRHFGDELSSRFIPGLSSPIFTISLQVYPNM
jgi:hypothetical protein